MNWELPTGTCKNIENCLISLHSSSWQMLKLNTALQMNSVENNIKVRFAMLSCSVFNWTKELCLDYCSWKEGFAKLCQTVIIVKEQMKNWSNQCNGILLMSTRVWGKGRSFSAWWGTTLSVTSIWNCVDFSIHAVKKWTV